MIYCVTTHFPPFCCCPFYFLFFYHEEIYLSKEKQCYLFVMLPCKYKSSTSCKLHSLSCKNLLVLSNLYHRCLCHTYVNACLDCVFIYWEYINHFMYRSVFWFVYNYNNWPKGFSQWFLQKSTVKGATQQWWNGKEKKSHFVFLFLFLSFTLVFSPLGVFPQGDDDFRHNSIEFILSHHIRAEVSFGWYLIILETMCH